jgi:hypothetical protein
MMGGTHVTHVLQFSGVLVNDEKTRMMTAGAVATVVAVVVNGMQGEG